MTKFSTVAVVSVLIACATPAGVAQAGNTWTGSASQDWNDPANWGGTAVAGNLVINNAGVGVFPLINGAVPTTAGVIDINVGLIGGTGRLDQRTDILSTGNGNWMRVGVDNGSAGTYNLGIAGGSGTFSGLNAGTGSLNVGGTSTTSGRLIVGNATATGTVNMFTSGTLKLEDDNIGLLLGDGGTSTGNFNLDGGTLQVNSAANIAILVGTNGGDGNFRMSGGTVNANGQIWFGDNNAASQGNLTMTGGAIVGNNLVIFGRNGGSSVSQISGGSLTTSGELWIGQTVNSVGNVTLSGTGVLNVSNWLAIGRNSASGLLTMTGGTINKTGGGNITLAGIGTTQTGTITQSAGTIHANSDVWIGETGIGVYNLSGTGVMNIGGVLSVGHLGGSNGTVNQSGGSITSTVAGGEWRIANSANSTGNYNISAGSLNTGSDNFQVGASGNGTLTQTGGTVSTTGFLAIGRFGGGVGLYNISAGSLTANTQALTIVGEDGNGTLTVSGTGTVNASNLTLALGGSGVGSVNLNGGTIVANQVSKGAGPTATFNFNGGTLRATTNNATFMQGLTSANVIGGNSTIDTQANSITIAQNLLHGGTGGGITKSGTGTLTLSGNNTYIGATNVNQGTLALAHASNNNIAASNTINVATSASLNVNGLASSRLVLANGQTLKGPGTVTGSVTAGPGSTIAPGASIESLGISGAIGFNQGTYQYEINTAVASADLLYGGDNTTLDLDNNPILSLIDLGSGANIVGAKFTLIAYDGLWDGGVFAGYADDSLFTFAGNQWLINYNDFAPGSNFVGDATSNGTRFVTITATPEPTMVRLALLGTLGLALFAWRQRRRV